MENGKLLLEESVSLFHSKTNPIRCFSAHELNTLITKVNHDLTNWYNWYSGVIDGRPVMIRAINDIKYLENLARDIAVSAQMSSHNNVHKLLGCCLETKYPVLVYERVANETLSNRIHGDQNRTQLDWKEKLRIGWEISHAVAYLHTCFPRPIIHRELKPGNIMLDQDNAAKLTNFSLCISIPKGKTSLEDETPVGTYGYASLESVNCGKVMEKSDVYSFGVLFLELLTGQTPSGWDTITEYYNSIQEPPDSLMDYSGNRLGVSFNLLVWKFVKDNTSKIINGNRAETPNEDRFHRQLQASIEVALSCIAINEDSRPTMEEVATQLKNIITHSESLITTDQIVLESGEQSRGATEPGE